MEIAVSFARTWTATMVRDSHCVGFTLPGMIELPGSFSGNGNFTEAASGAAGQPADVVGDFHQIGRHGFECAVGIYKSVF